MAQWVKCFVLQAQGLGFNTQCPCFKKKKKVKYKEIKNFFYTSLGS